MKYILFIASFNAFFFLVLLLQKKPRLLHDRIFIFWLFYLGGITAIYAFSMESFASTPVLSGGIIALFLLHGPFLYLYVSTLAFNHNKLKIKNSWHFAPFVAFILYLLIASGFPAYSAAIRVDHVAEGGGGQPILFLFFLALTALSGPVYFVLAQRQLRKTKVFNHNFSSSDIELDWLGKLIPAFGIIWTALIIIAVIHHIFYLFTIDFCINGLMLSLSAFIILIGYFGLKQIGVFISYTDEKPKEAIIETENSIPSLKDDDLDKCFCKIDDYFKTERPYLEPDLTLPKLAKSLNVPHHHLSQVINEVYGQNFFDFINKYRVEEVKNKIVDPQFDNYSLLGIAFESGFNSKSAFNRVFKKFTGKTPSEFRNSQQ
ncbi:transcriptional regulator, AraC family [Saccharicrinis carchari]|uniref:Transcriptional regulator, AraC family n=1 Tax=Saccharicrinis carchari TaxID=1168039 RepID=A0A521B0D9_SACCC|nr:helix-turn-helix domain-containing protein [Saccharicrinis carchari]SMO40481.1 transcriptional regulator, AraC family [Saccharicrinis carchari]